MNSSWCCFVILAQLTSYFHDAQRTVFVFVAVVYRWALSASQQKKERTALSSGDISSLFLILYAYYIRLQSITHRFYWHLYLSRSESAIRLITGIEIWNVSKFIYKKKKVLTYTKEKLWNSFKLNSQFYELVNIHVVKICTWCTVCYSAA